MVNSNCFARHHNVCKLEVDSKCHNYDTREIYDNFHRDNTSSVGGIQHAQPRRLEPAELGVSTIRLHNSSTSLGDGQSVNMPSTPTHNTWGTPIEMPISCSSSPLSVVIYRLYEHNHCHHIKSSESACKYSYNNIISMCISLNEMTIYINWIDVLETHLLLYT